MDQVIREEIRRFVQDNPENRFPDQCTPYFQAPLVGIAAADDPLFQEYKQIIGPFHLTPAEMMAAVSDTAGAKARSVISWILPIVGSTRQSNRREDRYPSLAWVQTRTFGEKLNMALRRHLVAWLQERGFQAVAPQLSPAWKEYGDTPVGIASAWSERHAAYAAGLGTFSLNDALITPAGIAHRCGSLITDLEITPSARPYANHRENCLYHRDGSCGICVKRCPVGALSLKGHDKNRCRDYVYGEVPHELEPRFGLTQTGCGLCQTAVPCEGGIPASSRKAQVP